MFTRIQNDLVAAMKAHDKQRLSVIKMVKAAIDKERIDKKCEVTDELVMDVFMKQVKMREDSISEFKKAGRLDLQQAAEEEIAILQEYLPTPLTKEEVESFIQEAFDDVQPTGMKDMGKIMGIITPKVKGRYDLKEISTMIKSKLN